MRALGDPGTTYLDYGQPHVALGFERRRWAEPRCALLVLRFVPRHRHVETGECSSRELHRPCLLVVETSIWYVAHGMRERKEIEAAPMACETTVSEGRTSIS